MASCQQDITGFKSMNSNNTNTTIGKRRDSPWGIKDRIVQRSKYLTTESKLMNDPRNYPRLREVCTIKEVMIEMTRFVSMN